jgi:predicted MPP superfamily phosphohydrolase
MTFRRAFLFLLLLGLALLGFVYWTATRDPVVRETEVRLARWPAGQPPLRAVLAADIHVAGPDMPPARLARIVAQINALGPDIVLMAGDFISDRRVATRYYGYREALVPLAGLRARLGTFAVLGNHDHWRDADEATEALEGVGVRVLANEAVRVGPLALGGLDDAFTDHDDLDATVGAMRRVRGARLMLAHSPDRFPDLPADVPLMLAGHTHCGQIRLPFFGALSTGSRYGQRYACGRIDENDHTLIVTAGLGTSIVPLRLGTTPELWLIRLGPEQRH